MTNALLAGLPFGTDLLALWALAGPRKITPDVGAGTTPR